MKKYNIFLIYLVSFLYLEFFYRILLYDSIFRITSFNMIIFVIFLAFVLFLITKLCNERINKILFYVLLSLICTWFGAQFVVKDFMDFYISFSILQIADQAGAFFGKAVLEVLKRLPALTFMFLPLILSIYNRKKIDFNQLNYKESLVSLFMCFCLFFFYYESLYIKKSDDYSAYTLFHTINNPSINVEKVGVLNTFWVDIYRVIFGFEDKFYINKDEEMVHHGDYNNLNIDFDSLINETDDTQIKAMSQYFKNESGTLKNEYTGLFEGKNIILFMAESFNEIALQDDVMPTLKKMASSSFVFDNYYTPTIYSTIGGEFQELTGLYANFTSLSEFREGTNSFPMGVATMFKQKGYNTYAYHNNDFTFQDRNVYLQKLGFDYFLGCGNGLEQRINCEQWPQSDVELIETTYEDYINSEEPFMVFYASVSGHASYNWNNAMAKKHKEDIEKLNLKYSEPVQAYLAAQMELDNALTNLLKHLEDANKLEDTVIILVGDHYPYELTLKQINEISSYKKDGIIEINRSKLVIYNSDFKTTHIEKVGSQIDVMPTIYNLFNIPYDSRLMIGNDILSTKPGIAIFADNSWVTNEGRYFATKGKYKPNNTNDAKYVKRINMEVQSKIAMSKYIMDKNYYNIVWNYVK